MPALGTRRSHLPLSRQPRHSHSRGGRPEPPHRSSARPPPARGAGTAALCSRRGPWLRRQEGRRPAPRLCSRCPKSSGVLASFSKLAEQTPDLAPPYLPWQKGCTLELNSSTPPLRFQNMGKNYAAITQSPDPHPKNQQLKNTDYFRS